MLNSQDQNLKMENEKGFRGFKMQVEANYFPREDGL